MTYSCECIRGMCVYIHIYIHLLLLECSRIQGPGAQHNFKNQGPGTPDTSRYEQILADANITAAGAVDREFSIYI